MAIEPHSRRNRGRLQIRGARPSRAWVSASRRNELGSEVRKDETPSPTPETDVLPRTPCAHFLSPLGMTAWKRTRDAARFSALTSYSPCNNCRHAFTVFAINIAIVIGPMPPGTGVIALT